MPISYDTGSSRTLAANSTTVTTASITTNDDDELLVLFMFGADNTVGGDFRAVTSPTPLSGNYASLVTSPGVSEDAFNVVASFNTTTGADTTNAFAHTVKTTAGSTGELRATAGVSSRHGLIVGAFKLPPFDISLGKASEIDQAQVLSASLSTTIEAGQEVDVASLFNLDLQIEASQEIDSAQSFSADLVTSLIPAEEVDSAAELTVVISTLIVPAIEVDEAFDFSPQFSITIEVSEEIDQAYSLSATVLTSITAASETDIAWGFTVSGQCPSLEEIFGYETTNGSTLEEILVSLHLKVNELYLIHGLASGSPLVVTSTARNAGAVDQSINESSGTVTVTRN